MAASLNAASRANELLAAAYEEEEALCPDLLPGVRDRASSQRERWAEVSPRLAELAPLPPNAYVVSSAFVCQFEGSTITCASIKLLIFRLLCILHARR